LVQNALKPAQINRVEIVENGQKALVWLDEDQRSLAIGKMGQNIALASRLVGMDIQLVQSPSVDARPDLGAMLSDDEGVD